MDVRELQLPDSSVDVAIDKGTLDAMIHGSLWDPPADVRSNVGKYVEEVNRFIPSEVLDVANCRQVARVLRPGGQWLYITYRQPHFVKPLLERKDLWDLTVKVLGNSQGTGAFDYFGFIMKRHPA